MAENVPQSIGFIMDGNRRWARQQGMTAADGHRAGYEKLKEVARWAGEAGVRYCYVYTLSTENWKKRSEEERNFLFALITDNLQHDIGELTENNIRIHVLGHTRLFPQEVQDALARVEHETAANTGLTLNVCFGYGGRAEIVHAVNTLIARHGGDLGEVTEGMLATELWSAGMPDPDLVVRTGGEQRLSGFLTWQSVYSELMFVDTFWPALTREEFDAALAEYATRERRMGK